MLTCHLRRSIMNSRRRDRHADSVRRATTSRRALLTASGAVAIGALSRCLNRVASSVTNATATPAAVFAGAGDNWNDDETEVGVSATTDEPHTSRLTSTLEAGSGILSGEVELERWVTSTALVAANYNNSRSNKSTIRVPEGMGIRTPMASTTTFTVRTTTRPGVIGVSRGRAISSTTMSTRTTRRSGSSRGWMHSSKRRRRRLSRRSRSGVRERGETRRLRRRLPQR